MNTIKKQLFSFMREQNTQLNSKENGNIVYVGSFPNAEQELLAREIFKGLIKDIDFIINDHDTPYNVLWKNGAGTMFERLKTQNLMLLDIDFQLSLTKNIKQFAKKAYIEGIETILYFVKDAQKLVKEGRNE